MRLHQIIDIADARRPNNVPKPDKIRKVWQFETEIAEMMETDFPEWDLDTDDPEMLIKAPHDEIYILYLLPYIDSQQEEMDLYQADAIIANQAITEFKALYRRSYQHTPRYIKGVFI